MTVKSKSKGAKRRQLQREKQDRIRRREQGLCTKCGRNKPPKGRRQCGQCGQRDYEAIRLHRSREKIFGDRPAQKIKERDRSIEIFNEALRGEVFGPNPGFVDLKIFPFVYSAVSQRQIRLPGLDIELLVSTEAEVHEMFKVMRSALSDWIAGMSSRSERDPWNYP